MATIQINLQSTDAAKRDLTNTRQAIADINKQIAENTRAITRSDQAGQQKLRTQNQNLSAERGLLRSVRESTQIKLAGLRMEDRALQANLRVRQQAAREQQRINRQEQAAAGRLFAARQNFLTNLSFILGTVNRQLLDLNANFIRSAANLETFGNTLRIAEGSAAAGADALDRLLQITIDLVGIDTSDLIAYYSRLRLAGGAAEDVEVILRGATEAVAEQGKSVAVTRRVLEQLTQAYQSQTIVYQDFRPILRELPTLYQDASRALGQHVFDLESFRAAADNVGGARNAIVATFRAIEERSEGANLNTFNAQLEQVRDQLFVLSAEIGRELLPALTGLLRNASQLVGGFRELNPSVKGLIGFTSLAAAGVTTLGLAASTLTVTVGFLNTSLISLTGVGGLAGFFAFLGPIAAGVGLVTAALAPLALLIARSAQESREAAAATRRFQDAISSANRAFQDQNGIKSQIQSLQQYIRTQEEFLSNQRQIFQRGRQSPSRARAIFTSERDDAGVRAARSRVDIARTHLSILERINQERAIERGELRSIELTLSTALTAARNAGNAEAVTALEQTAEQVLGLYAQLNDPASVSQATVSFRNFRLELAEAGNTAFLARDAFTRASNLEDLQIGYRGLEQAIRRTAQVELNEISQQIRAQGQIILSTERGTEARTEAENRIRELVAERRDIELGSEQAVFTAKQRYLTRSNTLRANVANLRIQAVERARDVEIASYQSAARAGQAYANTLRGISDVGNRAEFQRLVDRLQDQGLSFQQALTEAQRYIGVINSLSTTITAADIAYGQFNSTIGQTPTSQITRLLDGARQIGQFLDNRSGDLDARVAAGAASNQEREAQVGGSDVLGDLQQDARAQGVQFLIRQRDQQLRELARSAAQVERTIDGALSRIGGRLADTFVSVISDGTASLQDLGREFLAFSARILARTVIEIAQQKTLQAEITRTNALRTAGLVSSVANPASALSLLSFLIPAGGQLFHNPISDRIAQRGGRQASQFLRDDVDTQVQNSRDFVDNFVPNFFRDFARLGVQAGAAASGGSTSNEPRGPIVVQLQLNKRTIEEITIEMDDLESQGRISRTRQRKSLIGKEDPNRR